MNDIKKLIKQTIKELLLEALQDQRTDTAIYQVESQIKK